MNATCVRIPNGASTPPLPAKAPIHAESPLGRADVVRRPAYARDRLRGSRRRRRVGSDRTHRTSRRVPMARPHGSGGRLLAAVSVGLVSLVAQLAAQLGTADVAL